MNPPKHSTGRCVAVGPTVQRGTLLPPPPPHEGAEWLGGGGVGPPTSTPRMMPRFCHTTPVTTSAPGTRGGTGTGCVPTLPAPTTHVRDFALLLVPFARLSDVCPRPPCDIPSGCCSFTGPWTVTRSSLRMLRRVAAFCRPLRPVLVLVSFPRSRSPEVGALGLC